MTVRAVFDCMVFLQGTAREQSPAGVCLKLVETGQVVLCLSSDVVEEIREVLSRPKLRKSFPSLTPQRVDAALSSLQSRALIPADVPRVYSYPRDPDDEPYVNLAIAADASYLVSRDRDLLDLMSCSDFRQRFPNLIVLEPVAFLHELGAKQQVEQSTQESQTPQAGSGTS